MQAPREPDPAPATPLPQVEWEMPPAELRKQHPKLHTLAQRFIDELPGVVSVPVRRLKIAPHDWIDDSDSETHLTVDLFVDVGQDEAFAVVEEAADLIESLEADAGLPVGDSVIVPHWPV